MTIQVIPIDGAPHPLDVLHGFRGWPRPALLHGASSGHDMAQYSFFSADPVDEIDASAPEWPSVRDRIRRTFRPRDAGPAAVPFAGGWIGWFAYELGRAFDAMRCAATDPLGVPDVALALYDWAIVWDHAANSTFLLSTGVDSTGALDARRASERARMVKSALRLVTPRPAAAVTSMKSLDLQADFTPDGYRAAVAQVIEHVLRGDIFQANLAQRFVTPFSGSAEALFDALIARTSPPMAAYVAHGKFRALSASPERFLRFDPVTRNVETRPIKGTRPRGTTPDADAAQAAELQSSEKDRAENVMIVDLLRNDLARVAARGSIEVPALCRLESYPTVHHLVSTVTATLRDECDAIDLLEATFPGGSVTGAPKLRAMEVIGALEPVRRGVYCGAIGWIGLDGGMDTNVAIRTIVLDGTTASIHAGGGVTARSDPDEEYRETLDKARALIGALGDMR